MHQPGGHVLISSWKKDLQTLLRTFILGMCDPSSSFSYTSAYFIVVFLREENVPCLLTPHLVCLAVCCVIVQSCQMCKRRSRRLVLHVRSRCQSHKPLMQRQPRVQGRRHPKHVHPDACLGWSIWCLGCSVLACCSGWGKCF